MSTRANDTFPVSSSDSNTRHVFTEKYYLVGKLLRPGEQHTSYSDEEEEVSSPATATATPGSPGGGDKKNE